MNNMNTRKVTSIIVVVLISFSGVQSYLQEISYEDDCTDFMKIGVEDLACTKESNPVCGTDGVTYINKCMFCAEKLKQKTNIGVKHMGLCVKGYKIDCILCNKENLKLCGTDGVTYENECELCAQKQKLKIEILAKHKGACNIQGKKLDCAKYVNANFCMLIYLPHCGSDGLSYGNECDYCNAQIKNPQLSLLFEEHCYYNNELSN